MQAIQLIQVTPDELRSLIAEELSKLSLPAPVKVQKVDPLLNQRQAMELLQIKNRSAFHAWCIRNKVFGNQVGKQKMFLESKLLAPFQK